MADESTLTDKASPQGDAIPLAKRGWYLAVEYGVLARDRFLNRLPKLRQLGSFKELLEEGGTILYRNLFRVEQVKQAWDLLTALKPWQDRLRCYLNGEVIPIKEVQDILWCAAFPSPDGACRGPLTKKERPIGCLGSRLLLGATQWDLEEEGVCHAMTFSRVEHQGVLTFDRAAIVDFLARGQRNRLCPVSPARDPERFAAALTDVSVSALGWPLVAEMGAELKKQIGNKVLEKELGFVLKKGQPDLEAHAQLELRLSGGEPGIHLAGTRAPSITSELRLPVSARRVLDRGHLLRAVRMEEAYTRRKGGHYELEQRYLISSRVHLLPTDRPLAFSGYQLTTFPRSTPGYLAWVERVVQGLP